MNTTTRTHLTTGTTVAIGPKNHADRLYRIIEITGPENYFRSARTFRKVKLVRLTDDTTWMVTIKGDAKRIPWNVRLQGVTTDADRRRAIDAETAKLEATDDSTSDDTEAALAVQGIRRGQVWISKKYATSHEVSGITDGLVEMTGPVGNHYEISPWDLRNRFTLDDRDTDPREETPTMTTESRPFQTGDRVTAGYHMVGCERRWVEAPGRITTVWDKVNEPDQIPALALVTFDNPAPVPCGNPAHDHEPYTVLGITLTEDLTEVVYDHNRIELIQEEA